MMSRRRCWKQIMFGRTKFGTTPHPQKPLDYEAHTIFVVDLMFKIKRHKRFILLHAVSSRGILYQTRLNNLMIHVQSHEMTTRKRSILWPVSPHPAACKRPCICADCHLWNTWLDGRSESLKIIELYFRIICRFDKFPYSSVQISLFSKKNAIFVPCGCIACGIRLGAYVRFRPKRLSFS